MTVSSELPIGIFDSGIGGLTVLSAIRKTLPHEDLVYLGDTARVPYGTKSPETVIRYTRRNVDFLKTQGVKAIVVACNTASAVALGALGNHLGLPLVGVLEPGVERAAAATRNRRVAVIGTASTIASDAYGRALRRLNPQIKVVSRACPLFVPLVEEGWVEGEIPTRVARHYLQELVGLEVDTLILGCTHYPLLRAVIGEVIGSGVTLIDSAESVASSLKDLLREMGLARPPAAAAKTECFVTDDPKTFAVVGSRLVSESLSNVSRVDI